MCGLVVLERGKGLDFMDGNFGKLESFQSRPLGNSDARLRSAVELKDFVKHLFSGPDSGSPSAERLLVYIVLALEGGLTAATRNSGSTAHLPFGRSALGDEVHLVV
jgi:hypothetical protein